MPGSKDEGALLAKGVFGHEGAERRKKTMGLCWSFLSNLALPLLINLKPIRDFRAGVDEGRGGGDGDGDGEGGGGCGRDVDIVIVVVDVVSGGGEGDGEGTGEGGDE